MDWVAAQWRWLLVAAVVLFALNNFVGFVVGGIGLMAFVNGLIGRVLRARRVVEQIQRIVIDPDDVREEAGPKRLITPPDHRS